MNSSLPLGSIRGIRIGANWSLVVIFALIVWTLSDGILPDQNPGLSDATYLAMAVVAAVLFFASILAHELGHAFVARREGMEIDGITLWLFGGVAKFRGEFPSAGGEFRIAIAGPVVSAVIGGVCVGLARAGLPDAVDGVVSWLGYINLLLLVFNLLPALPLDGGRVLRSLLWKTRGDFVWATRVAARIGQGFGVAMIVGGIALVFFETAFSGAWLAFIGWFLLMAAGDELRHAARRGVFRGLSVRDVMERAPEPVGPDAELGLVLDGAQPLETPPIVPVVLDGRAIGALPAQRIAGAPRGQWEHHLVSDFMLPLERVPVLSADEALAVAAAELGESHADGGLVLEDGHVVGVLTAGRVLAALGVSDRAPGGPE